jgi:dTDP-4-dehydrorhamnose 3,5-epimerase-like enzyme
MADPHIIKFPKIGNCDFGFLSLAEKEHLPFIPKRIYWTYNTPENIIRGNHSHYELQQILVAVAGSIKINIINARGKEFEYKLDSPDIGLYIPKQCWRTLVFSSNSVLMSIASNEYSESDYIRNYEEFKKQIKKYE